MFGGKQDRPYFASWLRRTRKQLAGSGRLSEVALLLARQEGGTPESWTSFLRRMLDETTTPSLDLLTRIDALLAKPAPPPAPPDSPELF